MSKPIPKTKNQFNFEIDQKTGIIKYDGFWGAWTEIYEKTIDLRGFIKELAGTLMDNDIMPFTDVLEEDKKGGFFEHYVKGSEFAKPSEHWNRSKHLFERRFTWAKYNGFNEMELVWEAKCKTKYSEYGWCILKIDFVSRVIKDVEVVDDKGNKKIMQKGKWEFRNTLTYYNNYIPKALHNIPFVKDSFKLQEMIFDYIYVANVNRDLEFVETKIKPIVWNIIHRTFK